MCVCALSARAKGSSRILMLCSSDERGADGTRRRKLPLQCLGRLRPLGRSWGPLSPAVRRGASDGQQKPCFMYCFVVASVPALPIQTTAFCCMLHRCKVPLCCSSVAISFHVLVSTRNIWPCNSEEKSQRAGLRGSLVGKRSPGKTQASGARWNARSSRPGSHEPSQTCSLGLGV